MDKMKKIILNQKSNLLYDEIVEFKKSFDKIKPKNYEFIIYPPLAFLSLFKDSKYKVGTQNFFSINTGSFTGELNMQSLKDMGINYTLLGHFERKKIINESKEIIKEKLYKSLSYKCNTILCVGEDNKLKRSIPYIRKELNYYLKSIESASIKYLSVAYIPSHAMSISPKDTDTIYKVVDFIKSYFKKRYDIDIDVYYGGYIENSNIKEIMEACDGLVLDNQSCEIKIIKELIKDL